MFKIETIARQKNEFLQTYYYSNIIIISVSVKNEGLNGTEAYEGNSSIGTLQKERVRNGWRIQKKSKKPASDFPANSRLLLDQQPN